MVVGKRLGCRVVGKFGVVVVGECSRFGMVAAAAGSWDTFPVVEHTQAGQLPAAIRILVVVPY